MRPRVQRPGGPPIRSLLARLAIGLAPPITAFLVEIGLDEVVGPEPWLVVSFIATLLATTIGGPTAGLLAGGVSYVLQVGAVPALVPAVAATAGGLGWLLEGLVVVAGYGLGLGIHRAIRVARRPADRLEVVRAGSAARSAAEPVPVPDDQRGWVGALGRAVAELSDTRTPVQIADTVARHVFELCGPLGVAVYLRDDADQPDGGLPLLARTGSLSATVVDRLEATPSGPVRDRPASPSTALIAVEPSAGDPAREALRTGRPAGDARRTALPIPVDGATGGIVEIHGVAADPRGRDGLALAQLVTGLAGQALERNRLRTQRRSATGEASQAAGRLANLNRLTAELVGATDTETVARIVVDRAVEDLGAGFALVYTRDPSEESLSLVHARGYPTGLAQRDARLATAQDGPATRAARSGEAVQVGTPEAWRRTFPASSDVLAMTGTQSLSAIPLRSGDAVRGVVVVGWRRSGGPTRPDREILAAIADQGAQALDRARLHAQEQEARRLQEAFIGVVSHELRTPITTILAGSRLLRRRIPDGSAAAELSSDVEAEADRLARIVEDLLVLSRLERRHLTVADDPVHLPHLVNRVVANEAARWPEATFAVGGSSRAPVVRGEETYIEQVLRNLLSNAAKYSPAGSTVEVEIDDDDDGVAVRVLDEGPGVARSEVEQLFSLFYRSPSTAASAAGAGIGLFVSRQLVDQMGGRMWARPRPGGGSEFGFRLAVFPIDEEDGSAMDEADEGREVAPIEPVAAGPADPGENAPNRLIGGAT